MLKHDRQDKVFVICQVAHQLAIEVGKVSQKAADGFTLAGPSGFAQHRVRALGEPVYQRVQRVVVGVQHLEPPCDAGFQPGKLREIGAILDLVMAGQVTEEPRAWALQPLAMRIGGQLSIEASLRVCGQRRLRRSQKLTFAGTRRNFRPLNQVNFEGVCREYYTRNQP